MGFYLSSFGCLRGRAEDGGTTLHSTKCRLLPADLCILNRAAIDLAAFKQPHPLPQPSNPSTLRMRLGLRRPGNLTGPHPMVRRLFRVVICPRRSGIRDVWVE